MAKLIVRRVLRVENFVGLLSPPLNFSQPAFIVRGCGPMVFHRQLAIRLLDFVIGGIAIDAKHFVKSVLPCLWPFLQFGQSGGQTAGPALQSTPARPVNSPSARRLINLFSLFILGINHIVISLAGIGLAHLPRRHLPAAAGRTSARPACAQLGQCLSLGFDLFLVVGL